MSLESAFTRSWYSKLGWTYLLSPLLFLVMPLVYLKRKRFKTHRQKQSYQSNMPLIVVGNITVGGTGKSPMVIALAELLKRHGYQPGIITRGHKRQSDAAILVSEQSNSDEVGDEPLMLYRRTRCPVAVAARRIEAVKILEELGTIDILISDDGLQHYALDRDIEIIMVDAKRLFGNGKLLPVGPLREPTSRLEDCDFVFSINLSISKISSVPHFSGKLVLEEIVSVADSNTTMDLSKLARQSWALVAGIGNPQRFEDTLFENGIAEISGRFYYADHHEYIRQDLPKAGSVLATEKDAVKLERIVLPDDDWWYVTAKLILPETFEQKLLEKIKSTGK